MDEVRRISELLRETYEGNPWHGSSLKSIISGVTGKVASTRVTGSSHTIWEDVNHIRAWMEIARRRLLGEVVEPTDEQDWPPVEQVREPAWEGTVKLMDVAFKNLMTTISKFQLHDLERTVAGKDYDAYTLLHGVINHNVYHSGQISLLKKELTKRG